MALTDGVFYCVSLRFGLALLIVVAGKCGVIDCGGEDGLTDGVYFIVFLCDLGWRC
jgi:hypothetical protein